MADQWYVPVTVEFVGGMGHAIRAGVPDDVYAIKNAWLQEDAGFGLWLLTFRDHVTLTRAQRKAMGEMGCVRLSEGKPTQPEKLDRRDIRLGRIAP